MAQPAYELLARAEMPRVPLPNTADDLRAAARAMLLWYPSGGLTSYTIPPPLLAGTPNSFSWHDPETPLGPVVLRQAHPEFIHDSTLPPAEAMGMLEHTCTSIYVSSRHMLMQGTLDMTDMVVTVFAATAGADVRAGFVEARSLLRLVAVAMAFPRREYTEDQLKTIAVTMGPSEFPYRLSIDRDRAANIGAALATVMIRSPEETPLSYAGTEAKQTTELATGFVDLWMEDPEPFETFIECARPEWEAAYGNAHGEEPATTIEDALKGLAR